MSHQAAIEAGKQAEGAGRKEEALKHYTEAIEANPDEALGYLLRGAVLAGLERNEEALRDYNAVLQRDPGHAPALWGRGAVFRKLNRLDDSLADLEAAIQTQNLPIYQMEKANTLIVAQRYQEALETLGQVIQITKQEMTPQNVGLSIMALRTQGQIFRAHGENERADHCEKTAQQLAQVKQRADGRASTKSGCGGSAAAAALMLVPVAWQVLTHFS